MYFTQEDFKKIQEWLKRNSIKDSELPKADSLSREDFVTIVQNGHNKKIEVGKFLENPNILLNTEFNKNIEDESYYHWDIKILNNKRYALETLESKIIFKYCDISQKVVFQKDKFYTLSFSLEKPKILQRKKSFKINLGSILLNSINTNFEYSINEEGSIEILMNFKKDTFMYITFNTKDKTSDFESIIKFIYDAAESSEGISIYNIKLEEGEEATPYNLAKEDYSTKYNNQEKLVSGVNIKSISYTNLLGEGNLTLKDLGIDLDNVLKYIGVSHIELFEGSTQSYLSTDLTNGGINMEIGYIAKYDNKSFIWNGECWNELKEKQDKLVSGSNIKTINNQSILGSGNITIEGGGSVTIVNNLTDGGTNKALSAEMGKNLNNTIGRLGEVVRGTSVELNRVNGDISNLSSTMATKEDLLEYAKSADMITAEPADGEEVEDYVLMKSDVEHIIPHVVEQTDSVATIQPNTLNVWGEVESLDITLAEPTDNTIVNEYMAQFTSGSTATTLTLPNTIKWMTAPNIQPNKTYQLSVVNNLGVIGEFSYE